jgi:sterol desaturase/sphingolipid hydroxylase (fatty acid hydroxylase superfamily)
MTDPISKEWNYHPDLPLADSSIFSWPPRVGFLLRWFARNWLMLSERVMMVLLAVVLWLWVYPDFHAANSFQPLWIFQVWLANLALVGLSAGALHWYFFMRKGQGTEFKFDKRPLSKSNRLWDFSNQVHDNVFWSLTSGVGFLTLFSVITMWLMANGIAPMIAPMENPVWFALTLILLPIWSAFHFYWVHRLLHVPILYTRVHSLHHRNVNVGPWSGFSMHPIEHLIYCSSLCIHWFVPSDPILVIFHLVYLGPGAAMTHTGYEDLLIKDKRRLALGTFYHQLHHRYYECNYGNQEMPWDRWFGTFHDGSSDGTTQTRARKKKMYSKRV